jgi:transposase
MSTPIKYPEIYAEIRRCPTEMPASIADRLGFSAKTVNHVRDRLVKTGEVQNLADKNGIMHPEIYSEIRRCPTDTPVSIANRLGVSSRLVGHVRSRMIANGEVQTISTKSNRIITEEERAIILGLRQRGFSYPAIATKMNRSRGIVERMCVNARASGELRLITSIIKPLPDEAAPEPAQKRPLPRLSLNMTEAEERAVASLQNYLRNKTKLELLAMVRGRLRK